MGILHKRVNFAMPGELLNFYDTLFSAEHIRNKCVSGSVRMNIFLYPCKVGYFFDGYPHLFIRNTRKDVPDFIYQVLLYDCYSLTFIMFVIGYIFQEGTCFIHPFNQKHLIAFNLQMLSF